MQRFTINEKNDVIEDKEGIIQGVAIESSPFDDNQSTSQCQLFLEYAEKLEEKNDKLINEKLALILLLLEREYSFYGYESETKEVLDEIMNASKLDDLNENRLSSHFSDLEYFSTDKSDCIEIAIRADWNVYQNFDSLGNISFKFYQWYCPSMGDRCAETITVTFDKYYLANIERAEQKKKWQEEQDSEYIQELKNKLGEDIIQKLVGLTQNEKSTLRKIIK